MGKEVEKNSTNNKRVAKVLEDAWCKSMKERNGFLWWDGLFTKPVTKQYKISLCTTVMDRLKDLEQTLPQNIKDNSDYSNVEFVILDYNSKRDDVGRWIKSEMMNYIDEGRLVYYRTEEPEYYSMPHSRNVAFKIATGDIVNNVDADNFTNKEFAGYINKMANQFLDCKSVFFKKGSLYGRLGFFKNEFINILGGYNEDLRGYGHDDRDLLNRSLGLGFKAMFFGNNFFGRTDQRAEKRGLNYRQEEKNIRHTMRLNKITSYSNLLAGRLKANEGKSWGVTELIKNFKEKRRI